MRAAAHWSRTAGIAGAVAGLLASPFLAAPRGWLPLVVCAALALAAARGRSEGSDPALRLAPVPGHPEGSDPTRHPATRSPLEAFVRLAVLFALGALVGLGIGNARLAAIDGGALRAAEGDRIQARGYVASPPRRADGEVRVPIDTVSGRVLVVASEPAPDLPVGHQVSVSGILAKPEDWRAASVVRIGAALELRARSLRLTGGRRGGAVSLLDRARERAEVALSAGLDQREEALARGFVLGQDDRIDPATRIDFQRSGLAHILAVSGQNVVLLAILAGVLLALFGVDLRLRLILILLLICAYVPIAGGGPSIQRAGVMGAAAIIATLSGRPADRVYVPLLAAAATLALNPRTAADIGWQLSFAAVIGIMLWARPLRDHLLRFLARHMPDRPATALAEGGAMTIAATVATAPLMAHAFGSLSLAALPANLLVLPAVAPVMWIGMLAGMLGQIPAIPTAPLGAVEGPAIDYIAAVAHVFAAPRWATVRLSLPSAPAVIAAYAAMLAIAVLLGRAARRRRGLSLPAWVRRAGAVVLAAWAAFALLGGGSSTASDPATLRITALDVGQGDAILLEPPHGDPVLVDGGPPGGAAVDGLRAAGVEQLEAVFATHDQLDHVGGLFDVLDAVPVDTLFRATPVPRLEAAARADGIPVRTVAEGTSVRFGHLSLDVLWPPREPPPPGADPNAYSLTMAARFNGYSTLLTADGEASLTHLDPGPLDVLKVAHHGSDDPGLDSLLAHSVPQVALISVGADNTYGHPTAATLATLAEHDVCTLRTDEDGAATVKIGPAGLAIATERGAPVGSRPGCSPDEAP